MTPSRRRKNIQNAGASDSNSGQLLSLSLFIMLLAFFIVLNALSSFEEVKTAPVMESLETAFSTKVTRRDIRPSITPDPLQSIREGETVERLDALFKSQITGYDPDKNSITGELHITMPLDRFARAVTEAGQRNLSGASGIAPPKKFFLPTLISILKSDQKGVPYRMDILVHVPDNPSRMQNRKPQALAVILERAGALTRRLEAAGMPQRLLGIGLKEGDENTVEVFFRKHIPFSPLASEEQPQGQGE